jgi:hypothetical protein
MLKRPSSSEFRETDLSETELAMTNPNALSYADEDRLPCNIVCKKPSEPSKPLKPKYNPQRYKDILQYDAAKLQYQKDFLQYTKDMLHYDDTAMKEYKICIDYRDKCKYIIKKKNDQKYTVIFLDDNGEYKRMVQIPDEYLGKGINTEEEFNEAEAAGLTFGGKYRKAMKSKKVRKSRKSRKCRKGQKSRKVRK